MCDESDIKLTNVNGKYNVVFVVNRDSRMISKRVSLHSPFLGIVKKDFK